MQLESPLDTSSLPWDLTPAFIETALSRGSIAVCAACQTVLAVAVSQELAETTALANSRATRVGRELRCHDHAPAKKGAH